MKKFIKLSLLIGVFIIGSFIVSSSQVQAQTSTCYIFTSNLQWGSKGADVTALQNFLASKGFSTTPSGYFGKDTYRALGLYQKSVGIVPSDGNYGYFGPTTREKVNASCNAVAKKVTSAAPVVGKVVAKGMPVKTSAVKLAIDPRYSRCYAIPEDLEQSLPVIRTKKIYEVMQLQAFLSEAGFDTGSYNGNFATTTKDALILWQKQNNIQPAIGIADNVTRQRIRDLTCQPNEPYPVFTQAENSDGYSFFPALYVYEPGYSHPGITLLNSIIPLAIGSQGGDSYFSTNPGFMKVGLYRNGQKIDEISPLSGSNQPFGGDTTQFKDGFVVKEISPVTRFGVQTTFSVSNINGAILPGTYIAKIESATWNDTQITPLLGIQSSELVIASPTTTPSITVTSPNGGESFKAGDTMHIKWSSVGIINDIRKIGITVTYHLKNGSPVEYSDLVTDDAVYNTGSYDWIIPGNYPDFTMNPASFKIHIQDQQEVAQDDSDNYFSIGVTTPHVSILAPIGGEIYNIGSPMTIKWNTKDYTGTSVDLVLRRANTANTFPVDSGAQAQRVPNTGSYTWNIGNVGADGQYYVRVLCVPSATCNIADSNNVTIVASSTVITSVSPTSGYPGALVTVNGSGFGASNTVLFNGIIQNVLSTNGGTQLQFTIPANTPLDTYGLSILNSSNNANSNTIQYVVATSTPKVSVRLGASPDSITYPSGQDNLTFTVIDLKAQFNPNTITGIQVSSDSVNAPSIIHNIKVYDGSTLLGSVPQLTFNGSSYSGTISGVSFPLTVDVFRSLVLKADVPASARGPVRLGISGLNFSVPGTTVTGLPVYGSIMSIVDTSVTVSNTSASFDPIAQSDGSVKSGYFTFSFTLTNNISFPIYISKTISTLLLVAPIGTTVSNTTVTANGSTAGDTINSYIINGSRTFTYKGLFDNSNGTYGVKPLAVNSISYGTSTQYIATFNVTSGLENLRISPILSGAPTVQTPPKPLNGTPISSPVPTPTPTQSTQLIPVGSTVSTVNNLPPPRPILTAVTSSQCGGYIDLTWQPISGATNYTVGERPNSSGGIPLTTVYTGTATHFTDKETPGLHFFYRMTATTPQGESPQSTQVYAYASPACTTTSSQSGNIWTAPKEMLGL